MDPLVALRNTTHEVIGRMSQMARRAVSAERKRIALSHPILFGKVYTPWAENDTPDFRPAATANTGFRYLEGLDF